MQQHTKVALEARGYNVSEGEPIPCDLCWSSVGASDVHHIFNSHRGKRDNNVENLAILCLRHHSEQHLKWTNENSKQLQVKVKRILNNIEERKEMCRKYGYYL